VIQALSSKVSATLPRRSGHCEEVSAAHVEHRQRVRVGIPEPESAAVGGITGDDGAQSFRLFYGVLQR